MRLGREPKCLLPEPLLVSAKSRARVDAFGLEGHPVRSKIAFLKDMGTEVAGRCKSMGRYVIGPTIAEEYEIGDLPLAQKLVKKDGPLGEAAAEVRRRVRPVAKIAAVQIDPVNGVASLLYGGTQTAE
jgi:hypothetical protein